MRPPQCRSATSSRRSVIQPKSSVSSRRLASGSALCASNPALTISSSGAKASSAGSPAPFPGLAEPGAVGAGPQRHVDDVVRHPPLRRGAGAGVAGRLVRAGVEQVGVALEDVLGAVAVVDVEIHDRNPLQAPALPRVIGGDGGAVEQAEAHRPGALGMVARRPHRDEGGPRPALHDRVHAGDAAADLVPDGGRAAVAHERVAVDVLALALPRAGSTGSPAHNWRGEPAPASRPSPPAPARAAAARSRGAPAPAARRAAGRGTRGARARCRAPARTGG